MTDPRLQKRYFVTGLQPPLTYNVVMSLPANEQSDESVASMPRMTGSRRVCARFCQVALVAVALLGIGALAAACGGGPSAPGVASVGKTATTTGPAAAPSGSSASVEDDVLAYDNCMHTHGEPDMPDLIISGGGLHLSATSGSGFDPGTPQFTAANDTCQRLLPKKGSIPSGGTTTPADQADYLKAAACMRSHGVLNFPDPVFQNNNVEFNTQTPIDAGSPQYKRALATCEKLIPAGLPYSSPEDS
jgi:hypothetical protein